MPAEWFYLKGDKKCGPFGTAEMKRLAAEGQLSKEDLVWKTGATGSIRASRVKGLFPDEATETLPLPGSPEPAGKDEDVHEVKTAAFALFIALSKRIMGTTSRVLESASKYSGKLEADLREVQKNERKDPPAGVAANPKPLTNRTVARGSEGIEQASKKRIGAKRLMMLGGGGVGLALCVFLAAGSRTPTAATTTGESAATATGKSAAAKKALLQMAEKVEGPFAGMVEDIVDAVETGDQPFSVADSRMYEFHPDKHQFSPETISAYQRWRAAKLAEE